MSTRKKNSKTRRAPARPAARKSRPGKPVATSTDVDTSILAAIAESSLDALITIDSDSHILEFGPAAEKLFGYQRNEVMGKSVADIVIPPRLRQAHHDGMKKYLKTGEGPVLNNRVEVPAIRRDGSEFEAELTVVPIAAGSRKLFTAFIRDISARKAQEAEMTRAREAAEAASEAKSRFLAHMSHELRSPLNAVLGSVDLMLDSPLAPDQRIYAQTARDSGRALLGLIEDVLDFSRIESGTMELRSEPIDITPLIAGLMESAALKANARKLEVACYVAPDVPHVVQGDAGRLRQILANFLDNAIKFTDHGGVGLEVSIADKASSTLCFAVEDTGAGIANERRERLFQEFTQADQGSTAEKGGVGLGLAIVKRLVEAMGGTLGLASELGQGSRFWVELPLPVIRERHGALELGTGKTVLLITTNPIVRRITKRQIEAMGFTVACHDALSVLFEAQARNAALVLIDFDNVKGDTASLGDAVMSAGLNPARIFTMVRQDDKASAGSREGKLGHRLRKPIKPETLATALFSAVDVGNDGNKEQRSTSQSDGSNTGSVHVLLVEDGPSNQLIATAILKKAGYEVTVASNGHEAVEAASMRRFDLILMDLRMPVMDGLEATRRIRDLPGESGRVPVIALTANAFKEDIEQCHAAGMNDFVSKPINRNLLLDKMAEVLNESRDGVK